MFETRFDEFLASQRALYEVTDARLATVLERLDLDWFDAFFGYRPVRRMAVPALANGANSYGVRMVDNEGIEEVYVILGIWMSMTSNCRASAQVWCRRSYTSSLTPLPIR